MSKAFRPYSSIQRYSKLVHLCWHFQKIQRNTKSRQMLIIKATMSRLRCHGDDQFNSHHANTLVACMLSCRNIISDFSNSDAYGYYYFKKVGALRVVLQHSDLKSVMQCAHFLERAAVLFTVNYFIADTITQSQELS